MELIEYIGVRIREERTRLGLTQQEVADFVGVTRQSQAKYEKGARSPDLIYMEKVIELGFDSHYILTGNRIYKPTSDSDRNSKLEKKQYENNNKTKSKGYIETDVKKEKLTSRQFLGESDQKKKIDKNQYAAIPLYNVAASAGQGAFNHDEEIIDSMMFKKEWIHNELHCNPAHLYLLYIEGESMEPTLRAGDVILVDRTDNTAKRDSIYVLTMDGALLVKRLQRLPGGVIRISSDNPIYQPYEFSPGWDINNRLNIIGRVVWTGRRI